MVAMSGLPILPSETIYSFIARQAGLYAGISQREISCKWLGKDKRSVNQQLPCGLARLSKKSGYQVDELLNEHTCYPLFSGFVDSHNLLKRTMLSNDGSSLGSNASISQSAMKALSCHKYCDLCLAEDLQQFGVGYWHLEHQFLGVNACLKHGTSLKATKAFTRRYFLPPQQPSSLIISANQELIAFANFVYKNNDDFKWKDCKEICAVSSKIPMLVEEKGFVRGKVFDIAGLLRRSNTLSTQLFGEQILTESVIRGLISHGSYHCHPLKSLFLQFLLQTSQVQKRPKPCHVNTNNEKVLQRRKVMGLLKNYLFSMREISRRAKCSVGFVKAIAKQNAIPIEKRTQFIDWEVESRVIEQAVNGASIKTIALSESLSVGAVEQIIQGQKSLSIWRQYLRMLSKQKKCRARLMDSIDRTPAVTRNTLKKSLGAEYTWLYKYDRQWLYFHLPKEIPREHRALNRSKDYGK